MWMNDPRVYFFIRNDHEERTVQEIIHHAQRDPLLCEILTFIVQDDPLNYGVLVYNNGLHFANVASPSSFLTWVEKWPKEQVWYEAGGPLVRRLGVFLQADEPLCPTGCHQDLERWLYEVRQLAIAHYRTVFKPLADRFFRMCELGIFPAIEVERWLDGLVD